ncbi:MAG: cytidylate kinase-like family protein [Chloroflexi bacterium]|nr:MAG: cytidylate kinase-like family protein [Chloroflexota bacterium]
MAVITISRELGCDGDTIAQEVAKKLGYHLIDKEFVGAVMSEYGLIEFDREYDHLPTFWEKFDMQKEERREVLVDMLNRVIRAVAQHGNVVILGRSGYVILNEFADVLNVRIQAPKSFRVQRVAEQDGSSLEKAEEKVLESDKVRSIFIETFYDIQWESVNDFDICINRSKIPVSLIVNSLSTATQALAKQDITPLTSSIEVDATLAKAISEEFDCESVH